MNRYRMFFIETSTLTPSMHRKLTKDGKLCMQKNNLRTKTPVELKDNSQTVESYSIQNPKMLHRKYIPVGFSLSCLSLEQRLHKSIKASVTLTTPCPRRSPTRFHSIDSHAHFVKQFVDDIKQCSLYPSVISHPLKNQVAQCTTYTHNSYEPHQTLWV